MNNESVFRRNKTWVWCLLCERCYQVGEHRLRKSDRASNKIGFTQDIPICHYLDCNGHGMLDTFSWNYVRSFHPEYPEVPEEGKEYPLF